jgi:hypothetical protein
VCKERERERERVRERERERQQWSSIRRIRALDRQGNTTECVCTLHVFVLLYVYKQRNEIRTERTTMWGRCAK